MQRIGFGGGCHWCTEAVFQSLKGVAKVEQGFIASLPPYEALSEAVIVHYDPAKISLSDLIAVHIDTHSSTANHRLRDKYRSAVYGFDEIQIAAAKAVLNETKSELGEALVTEVLAFATFRPSDEQYQNYYHSNRDKPFCKTFIDPKLNRLRMVHAHVLSTDGKR